MQIKTGVKWISQFVFAATFLSVLLIQAGLASATQVPTISPNGGQYTSSQSVTIGNIDSGDTAYYTTDGSSPETSSAAVTYTESFTVSQSEIVRAAIKDSSGDWSSVATAVFIIGSASSSSIDTPTISPDGGAYTSSETVTIGNIDSGDTAYYTTDGSDPKTSSTATEYTTSLTVSQSEIVLAAVKDSSGDWSGVTRARFYIDDQSTTSDSSNISGLEQELISALNNNQMGEAMQLLSEIEQLSNQDQNNNSNYDNSNYDNSSSSSIDAPTISPSGGKYTSSETVTIGNIDSGDTAYYTTDGSNPKTSSTTTEYTGSFTVSQSEIVRAAVEDSSGDWSRVTRARFIIDDNNSDNNYDNSNNDDDNGGYGNYYNNNDGSSQGNGNRNRNRGRDSNSNNSGDYWQMF